MSELDGHLVISRYGEMLVVRRSTGTHDDGQASSDDGDQGGDEDGTGSDLGEVHTGAIGTAAE